MKSGLRRCSGDRRPPLLARSNQSYPRLPVRAFKFALGLSLDKDAISKLQALATRVASIDTPQGQLIIDLYQFVPANAEAGAYAMFYYRDSPVNPGYVEIMGVTQSKTSMAQVMGVYSQILIIAIPATILLAACLGIILVRRMLKPVNAMARTAREIEEKDLSRRINVQTQDELGQLAGTLNQTFSRLQKAFERERQFTADASHELRTPLAIMQGEASLALQARNVKKNTGNPCRRSPKKSLRCPRRSTSYSSWPAPTVGRRTSHSRQSISMNYFRILLRT